MSRREVLHRDVCAQEGCSDTTFTRFDTQREYREFMQPRREYGTKYRCSRHREPEKNLRPDNLTTTAVLTATRSGSGTFWYPEDGPQTGSGYTHGPGFNAHAEDFPEGTKLTITAQVETP
jgi:hypothetical protein